MSDPRYRLRLAPPACRAVELAAPAGLPAVVAAAVVDFTCGPLLVDPYGVGQPLVSELVGWHAARRGPYRVIYRVREDQKLVHVLRIDHRSGVYRP